MTTSQTYDDYIKLKSIFELEPPPTPDELESLGLERHPEWAELGWGYLCSLLYMRAQTGLFKRDMLKASNYYLEKLPPENQKQIRQLRAQPIEY